MGETRDGFQDGLGFRLGVFQQAQCHARLIVHGTV